MTIGTTSSQSSLPSLPLVDFNLSSSRLVDEWPPPSLSPLPLTPVPFNHSPSLNKTEDTLPPSHEFPTCFITTCCCPSPPRAPLQPSFTSPLPFHLPPPASHAMCPLLLFDLTHAPVVDPPMDTFLDVQFEVRAFKIIRRAVLQFLIFLSILQWYIFFLLSIDICLFLLCSCWWFYFFFALVDSFIIVLLHSLAQSSNSLDIALCSRRATFLHSLISTY